MTRRRLLATQRRSAEHHRNRLATSTTPWGQVAAAAGRLRAVLRRSDPALAQAAADQACEVLTSLADDLDRKERTR